ncbi:NXN isoform 5 [Crotalus adamanteus]|uniref:NXN isoform 5 n=1 Tax=Crotalus adamanteus TaxID=8729 RepID=A0AAW1CDS0_CROAD
MEKGKERRRKERKKGDSDDDGESEAAKQLIQPIAEKIIAQYKAKDEDIPLLFFVAGEDDMTDSLRDYTNLPEAAPLLTILDMSARAKYVMDVEEITPPIVALCKQGGVWVGGLPGGEDLALGGREGGREKGDGVPRGHPDGAGRRCLNFSWPVGFIAGMDSQMTFRSPERIRRCSPFLSAAPLPTFSEETNPFNFFHQAQKG